MIIIGNYAIEQHITKNQIIINLPQTNQTVTTIITAPQTRKSELNASELTAILELVKYLCENGETNE